MLIRSLSSFSLLTVFALGLPACGDDKDPMVTASGTSLTGQTGQTGQTGDGTTDGTTDGTEPDSTDGMTGTSDPGTTGPTTTLTTEPTTTTTTATTAPETTTGTTGTTTLETSTTDTTTDSGTTADDTTGGDDDGSYGPCGMMGECPAGSDCVSLMGVEGNFCSPQCEGMMCPAASGGAMAQCVLILEMGMDPTNCAAICNPMQDNCPAGTTCKDVPMQMGVGICTAP